ncbi:MAG: hypothetical protein SFV24_19225 [Gemmatimonadales bacterium]|nr:hypothetical protein [Gemmatimonadales bacterium]
MSREIKAIRHRNTIAVLKSEASADQMTFKSIGEAKRFSRAQYGHDLRTYESLVREIGLNGVRKLLHPQKFKGTTHG